MVLLRLQLVNSDSEGDLQYTAGRKTSEDSNASLLIKPFLLQSQNLEMEKKRDSYLVFSVVWHQHTLSVHSTWKFFDQICMLPTLGPESRLLTRILLTWDSAMSALSSASSSSCCIFRNLERWTLACSSWLKIKQETEIFIEEFI